jgi:hypothetical protein
MKFHPCTFFNWFVKLTFPPVNFSCSTHIGIRDDRKILKKKEVCMTNAIAKRQNDNSYASFGNVVDNILQNSLRRFFDDNFWDTELTCFKTTDDLLSIIFDLRQMLKDLYWAELPSVHMRNPNVVIIASVPILIALEKKNGCILLAN